MQNQDTLQGERMSVFHLIKRLQRREWRIITHVQDPVTETQTTRGFVNNFSSYVRRKYSPLSVDDECAVQMTEVGYQRLSEDRKEA
jgi:hypothetical protein